MNFAHGFCTEQCVRRPERLSAAVSAVQCNACHVNRWIRPRRHGLAGQGAARRGSPRQGTRSAPPHLVVLQRYPPGGPSPCDVTVMMAAISPADSLRGTGAGRLAEGPEQQSVREFITAAGSRRSVLQAARSGRCSPFVSGVYPLQSPLVAPPRPGRHCRAGSGRAGWTGQGC